MINPLASRDRRRAKKLCNNIKICIDLSDKSEFNLLVLCAQTIRLNNLEKGVKDSFFEEAREGSWEDIVRIAQEWFDVTFVENNE